MKIFCVSYAARSSMLSALLVMGMMSEGLQAETLAERLETVLSQHRLIRMVDADVAASAEGVDIERSAWYPQLSVNLSQGKHDIERDQGTSGDFEPTEQSIELKQLVWDFGLTNSRIQSAKNVYYKEDKERDLQKQNLLLAAVEAHLQVVRTRQTVEFSKASVRNIKRQTRLESSRIEAGRGYAADSLQARSQLASAQARGVAAQGSLDIALSRYQAVYGQLPVDPGQLDFLTVSNSVMPDTLQDAVSLLRQHNPDIQAAKSRADIEKAQIDVARLSELSPRLDFSLGQNNYSELDGAFGNREDVKAELKLRWNFNLGMKVSSSQRSASHRFASAQERAEYTYVQAVEEVENAWVSWNSAKNRGALLDEQAAISMKFLELARKERDMGKRSLLDILSGETSIINAQSDAVQAKVDESIAAFRLLRAVGGMSLDLFKENSFRPLANND
ncbi:TolC family protein [Amphritea sp.]|uniref:TolC family protein n=1 Tax=Amphritea sp. TaxID=1872502 RepID=UPI0025BE7E6C|nr:TolC family protein [Amphritea sp.]